jgi:hypothetical protein
LTGRGPAQLSRDPTSGTPAWLFWFGRHQDQPSAENPSPQPKPDE